MAFTNVALALFDSLNADSLSSLLTSLACCSCVKDGMMQCCGNKSYDPLVLMDRISGTYNLPHL